MYELINIQQVERGRQEQKIGRSAGGFSTKIHSITDALGCPVKFILTPGNEADCSQAVSLLEDQRADAVLADKGYDSQQIIDTIKEMGAEPVIPPRSLRKEQREYDRDLYKARGAVEIMFNRLKQFRRVACRYEKTASNFCSFVYLAGILIWLA